MKTRVVREFGKYYPERRFCFIWFRFQEKFWKPNFVRLEEAQRYIDDRMVGKLDTKEIIPYKTFYKRTDYTGPK